MSYDKDALKAIADPKVIASYMGMETKGRGRHMFIRCPSHEKTLGRADKSIGNCILTKTGFKCFACGAFGDVFDLVVAYENCSYPDAIKLVGDAYGGHESFLDKKYSKKRKLLPASDLALIGLNTMNDTEKSDEGRLLYNVSSKKEEETDKTGCMRRADEYLLYVKTGKESLHTLLERSPKLYYELVAGKAKEAAERYEKALADCDCRDSTIALDIFTLFGRDKDAVNGVKEALLAKKKRAENIFKEYSKLAQQTNS